MTDDRPSPAGTQRAGGLVRRHRDGHARRRDGTVPAPRVLPVTVASRQWQTADEIEQFVHVRLTRQERLVSDSPLRLWAVLSEAVLLQQVGGPEVMRAQVKHLLDAAERPNVTIQVLPFSRGAHASMFGPYVVLGFPEEAALDVVLADNPTGSI